MRTRLIEPISPRVFSVVWKWKWWKEVEGQSIPQELRWRMDWSLRSDQEGYPSSPNPGEFESPNMYQKDVSQGFEGFWNKVLPVPKTNLRIHRVSWVRFGELERGMGYRIGDLTLRYVQDGWSCGRNPKPEVEPKRTSILGRRTSQVGCREYRSLLDLEEADYHGGAENEFVHRLGDIFNADPFHEQWSDLRCMYIETFPIVQGKSINKLDEMSWIAR